MEYLTASSYLSGLSLGDLRSDLIQKSRKLACLINPKHAWLGMNDLEIMQDAGLCGVNPDTGRNEVTLAGLLLIGRDEALRDVLPGREIEAKAQVVDGHIQEYLELLQTNLLDTFERLMAFVGRYLPEGEIIAHAPLLCVRDIIFKEVLANFLVHRDYAATGRARLYIQLDRITMENQNRSGRLGIPELACIQAIPKNPLLYDFFRNIGWCGSPMTGMQLLSKWGKSYFGTEALVFDRNIFKFFATSPLEVGGKLSSAIAPSMNVQDLHVPKSITITTMQDKGPTPDPTDSVPVEISQGSQQKAMQVLDGSQAQSFESDPGLQKTAEKTRFSAKLSENSENMPVERTPPAPEERTSRILAYCSTPRNREEIQTLLGLNNRDYFRKEILVPLLRQGLLVATIPDKPNSPKQQYRTPG